MPVPFMHSNTPILLFIFCMIDMCKTVYAALLIISKVICYSINNT